MGRKAIFGAILFVTTSLFGAVNDQWDKQFWLLPTIMRIFNERWEFRVNAQFRFGDDYEKLYYQDIEGALFYFIAPKKVAVALGYRQSWSALFSTTTSWPTTYQPFFDFFTWKRRGNFTLFNRVRLEYSFRELASQRNHWTIRDRIEGSYRYFFLAEEVFFTQYNGFSQNRLMAGIRIPFKSTFNPDVGYMLRSLKASHGFTQQLIWFLGIRLAF